MFEGLDEETNEKCLRKRALTLPKALRSDIGNQAKEPLRLSGKVRKSLTQSAAASAAAGSSEAAARQSILEGETAETWRRRVGYSRAGATKQRVRLSRDVVDLWQPFRTRPTEFELFRPWFLCSTLMTTKRAWTTGTRGRRSQCCVRGIIGSRRMEWSRTGMEHLLMFRWKLRRRSKQESRPCANPSARRF